MLATAEMVERRQFTLQQVFSMLWRMPTERLHRILEEGVQSPLLAAAIAAELKARVSREGR